MHVAVRAVASTSLLAGRRAGLSACVRIDGSVDCKCRCRFECRRGLI